jgi:hypothetical protein
MSVRTRVVGFPSGIMQLWDTEFVSTVAFFGDFESCCSKEKEQG